MRTRAQLVGQPHDVAIGGQIELLLNERLVNRRMTNGAIPITRRGKRTHNRIATRALIGSCPPSCATR